MRLLLVAACLLGAGSAQPQFPPPDSAPPLGPGPPPAGGGGGGGQCGVDIPNMMDECCGMANEGCCVGGQECYTYYETVCENVASQRCRPRFKQICVEESLPYCTIQKKRGSVNIREEFCKLKSKRECFNWKRKVCDLRPANVVAEINWQNEKLVPKRNGSETRSKCEKVSKCKYEDVESIKTEKVPVKNCDPVTETKKECKRVPVPVTRVVEDVRYEVRYVSECSVVSQPRCETQPCQSNGCVNGGSVCSTTEFQPQTVCAEVAGQETAPAPAPAPGSCQQVDMPVCYGALDRCSAYDQQCCYNQPQQVCRQVPQRFPVRRNRTVTDYNWEEQCEEREVVRQDCRTEYETRNRTVTTQKCNQYFEEVCANYTVPQYEVKLEDKAENVSFVSRKCHFREVTEQYCQTFPNADYSCTMSKASSRDYILNKVVCREQKTVQFCQNIPEGECEDVPDQKCRVVPRQVCQQGCSTSNMCGRCDSFRNQGGFSSCATGTCPNYFPEDPTISGNFGSGFNPGNGGGNTGFNPGNGGNSGFNPGNMGGGDSGFNPGNIGGNSGFNPGNMMGNMGGGNSGYNPGYGYGGQPGGDLVSVGDEAAQLQTNDNWSPGDEWYSPGDRAQPLFPNFVRDGYTGLYDAGNTGYNPGYPYAPLEPSGGQGDSGYNPGSYAPLTPGGGGWNTGNGESGFNPGNSGVAGDEQPNGNEAFDEESEETEMDSLVL